MESSFTLFELVLQPAIVLVALIFLLALNSWIFKKITFITSNENITKGVIAFLLIFVGTLVFILVLPVDKALKGQILTFFGIITSAGIALSSTTILGNLIAGIMNNSMNRFRNGDLIKIGNLHGRVIRKSVFHTEIQLEDSNFTTIPNLFIANNPVKLIRKSNTVISASVSLGYDISRDRVEKALQDAAHGAGLTDPYMYITNLGDFSVTYEIHGFLEDSTKYFSSTSLLKAEVMDKLHDAHIEIVSPTFANQRRVDEKQFIPKHITETHVTKETLPEKLIFDEAIKSEKIETKKDSLKEIYKKQDALKEKLKTLKDEKEIEQVKDLIEINNGLQERLEKNVKAQLTADTTKSVVK